MYSYVSKFRKCLFDYPHLFFSQGIEGHLATCFLYDFRYGKRLLLKKILAPLLIAAHVNNDVGNALILVSMLEY